MNYQSTRNTGVSPIVSAAAAIKNGLAPDGGLYMPASIPALDGDVSLENLLNKSYEERAAAIIGLFLDDYTADELAADCGEAYSEARFPGGAAPIKAIGDNINVLELWHGPTCAFKDMALQLMPRLFSRALVKTGESRTAQILVATSGDTGKAALEGYRDVPQTKILVFYPQDGVSDVQKLQMTTQQGDNVAVAAIDGNFDDAQNGVKKIFADGDIREQLNHSDVFLSSANSINWGRLVPQIVYYVSAYCDLVKAGTVKMGDAVNICVPTGNFGNIFAAYIAREMGLPVKRFLCASNANNVLTDFLRTGTYSRNRTFYTTISPSMDILISSNLERLLYLVAGPEKTARYMSELNTKGEYTVDADVFAKIAETFTGYCCDDAESGTVILETYNDKKYLCDPHTAVGLGCALKYKKETGDDTEMILASTASPYKFAADVCAALGTKASDSIAALSLLSNLTGTEIPAPLSRTLTLPVLHKAEIAPDHMAAHLFETLGI